MSLGFGRIIVIKVGGSVLTDKRSAELKLNADAITRLGEDIGSIYRALSKEGIGLIAIHGAGSAGHPVVAKHGLHRGVKASTNLVGYTELHVKLTKLRLAVMEALHRSGVPASSLSTASIVVQKGGRIQRIFLEPIKGMISLGVVPVLSGDLVADEDLGLSVCSGDQLAFRLAEELGGRLVIFGVDVDGVYTAPPGTPRAKLISRIRISEIPGILEGVGGSSGIDVSGGMRGKLMEAYTHKRFFEEGGEAWILNATRRRAILSAILGKESRFTRITR